MTDPANRSYAQVLRNRRLAALLAGDLVSQTGNGMIIVALPVEALRVRGAVPPAVAVSLVATAPFVIATAVALAMGLGRHRLSPRATLLCDGVLRAAVSGLLGVLALTDALTLPVLVAGLLAGSAFRLAGASGRRLLATGMAAPEDRFAVNGLLGTTGTFAQYVVGPVLGGVITATAGPGLALLYDGCAALLLLAIVLSVTAGRRTPAARTAGTAGLSGWRVLRDRPVAARLFAVIFCFNLFYMPVEIALPLLVRESLDAGSASLGVLWGAFGVGAFLGSAGTTRLRRLPPEPVLVTIIALWALCPPALALSPNAPVAAVVFALGGLVWAPFTPIVYTYVQAMLSDAEQQPVVTLWGAGTSLAAPAGLALSGPLVHAAGVRPSLVLSGLLTVALLPLAGWGLLRSRAALPEPAPEPKGETG